jgi:hypothetical protein
VIVDVCPACGYPTLGPDLCAFCRTDEEAAGLLLVNSRRPSIPSGLFPVHAESARIR